MTAPITGAGPEAGVAGEIAGGGLGGEAIGGVAGEALPFTGSLLTIPLAIVGLVLTFAGWLVHRFGRERVSA